MMIGSEVGSLTAEMMDGLEEEYGGKEGVTVGTVAVIVELNWVNEDGEEITSVDYRCSDSRRWVQSGFFDAAMRACVASSEQIDE